MLTIKTTENYLGVEISGSASAFKELCLAIRNVAGAPGKRPCMAAAYVRVTAFCIAMEASFNAKNEPCSLKCLWIETAFIIGALSGFIKFESEDLSQKSFLYDVISSPKVIFNEDISVIRLFQSKVLKELENILTKQSFSRILNIYGSGHTYFVDYTTQFLDLMNCTYIAIDKEKRQQKLSPFIQNILTRTGKYKETENEVRMLAKDKDGTPHVIKLDKLISPDSFIW